MSPVVLKILFFSRQWKLKQRTGRRHPDQVPCKKNIQLRTENALPPGESSALTAAFRPGLRSGAGKNLKAVIIQQYKAIAVADPRAGGAAALLSGCFCIQLAALVIQATLQSRGWRTGRTWYD